MPRPVFAVFVLLLASCAHSEKRQASPNLAGRARFELFGMLMEYGERITRGHTIERFYPSESKAADHFEQVLREFCAEEGIASTYAKEVGPEGHITFTSPAIAAAINRHYTDGALDEKALSQATEADLLRYVSGDYLRFGFRDGIAAINEANAFRKTRGVGRAFVRLGCSRVKLYSNRRTLVVPTSIVLTFSPSPAVRQRLGVRKELTAAKLPGFPAGELGQEEL